MIHLLAAATADPARLPELKALPAFRKATRNMALAWLSVDAALEPLRAAGRVTFEDAAMILGSSHGELETTKEFLKGLADSRIARPLLFQNSLHNATLGFVTMRLEFTGITLTVSSRHFTGEDSLLTARDLIESGFCSMAIVTGVDTLVADLHEALLLAYPSGISLGEGAATVILASEEGRRRLGAASLGLLEGIDYERDSPLDAEGKQEERGDDNERMTAAMDRLPSGRYHDSDAIRRLVIELAGDEPPGSRPRWIELAKPNGSRTRIRLGKTPE